MLGGSAKPEELKGNCAFSTFENRSPRWVKKSRTASDTKLFPPPSPSNWSGLRVLPAREWKGGSPVPGFKPLGFASAKRDSFS